MISQISRQNHEVELEILVKTIFRNFVELKRLQMINVTSLKVLP